MAYLMIISCINIYHLDRDNSFFGNQVVHIFTGGGFRHVWTQNMPNMQGSIPYNQNPGKM